MKNTSTIQYGPSAKNINDKVLQERLAFSLRETAQLLGTSYVSIWRLIRRGLLRPSRALRTPKISREEIERFLRETTVNS